MLLDGTHSLLWGFTLQVFFRGAIEENPNLKLTALCSLYNGLGCGRWRMRMNPRNGGADLLLLLEEEGRRWEAKFATIGVKWRSAPRHGRSGLFNGSPPPH
jgi:hypothetical protein